MCELWNCTPAEALSQDPALVIPILGYMQAKEAIRQSNEEGGVLNMTRVQAELLANLRGETLQSGPEVPDESWLLEDG